MPQSLALPGVCANFPIYMLYKQSNISPCQTYTLHTNEYASHISHIHQSFTMSCMYTGQSLYQTCTPVNHHVVHVQPVNHHVVHVHQSITTVHNITMSYTQLLYSNIFIPYACRDSSTICYVMHMRYQLITMTYNYYSQSAPYQTILLLLLFI